MPTVAVGTGYADGGHRHKAVELGRRRHSQKNRRYRYAVGHPSSDYSSSSIFCEIWPFGETNALSDPSAKLFLNLTPEVGASMNGADVVQLGAMPSSCRRRVGAKPTGAELLKRTSADNMLASSCTTSAPSPLAPTSGVRHGNSFTEGSDEALVSPKGQISQKNTQL
jgi:hypothetical protein